MAHWWHVGGVVLFMALGTCHAAGMNTHTFVGLRAATRFGKVTGEVHADQYNKAIGDHLDAVLGGSDFPDWGYACGDNHSAGEAAHWPPWQAAAVTYLRSKPDFVSGNWSEDTSKLVAFVFGVSVHYIADELWEGLNDQIGRGQGFVRTLSSFNLGHDGLTDNDEGTANMAADFGVAWELNESGIEPWKRYWPIDEVVAIYNVSGNPRVTAESVGECKELFDLALWAEMTFGPILFTVYSEVYKKVPMVAERLVDLPIGGIDDMAVWASWVWQRLARWLNFGAPPLPPPNVDTDDTESKWTRVFVQRLRGNNTDRACVEKIFKSGDPKTMFKAIAGSDGLVFSGPDHLRLCAQRTIDIFWHAVAPHLPPLQRFNKPLITQVSQSVSTDIPQDTPSIVNSVTLGIPGGYSGRAIATGDWDGDGKPDIAYSSYGVGQPGRPQVGNVTVLFGNAHSQQLAGPVAHGRFGWSMVTLDWNHDGVDDLAVSAPTSSWEDSPEHRHATNTTPFVSNFGLVHVFTGSNTTGNPIPLRLAVNISTADPLTGLGDSLASGDIDGDGVADLLIGAAMSSFRVNVSLPDNESIRRGAVFGFVSRPSTPSTVTTFDARRDANLVLEGPSPYGWFGRSIAVYGDLLFVGAPGFRNNAHNTTGQVYAFRLPLSKENREVPLAATIQGDEALAEFGEALAIVPPSTQGEPAIVAVGVPASTKTRNGAVFMIPVNTSTFPRSGSAATWLTPGTVACNVIRPTALFARAGYVLTIISDHLVVSAPLAFTTPYVGTQESGQILGYSLPQVQCTGNVTSPAWQINGPAVRGRFGMAVAPINSTHFSVGAPFAGYQSEGSVSILALT